jgi:hypothetical protein
MLHGHPWQKSRYFDRATRVSSKNLATARGIALHPNRKEESGPAKQPVSHAYTQQPPTGA